MFFGKDLLSYSIWDKKAKNTSSNFANFEICTILVQILSRI